MNAHRKDNCCKVSLQSDQKDLLNFHSYHDNDRHFEISNLKYTTTHPKDHSCEVSKKIPEDEKKIPIGFYSIPPNYLDPSKYTQGNPSEKITRLLVIYGEVFLFHYFPLSSKLKNRLN